MTCDKSIPIQCEFLKKQFCDQKQNNSDNNDNNDNNDHNTNDNDINNNDNNDNSVNDILELQLNEWNRSPNTSDNEENKNDLNNNNNVTNDDNENDGAVLVDNAANNVSGLELVEEMKFNLELSKNHLYVASISKDNPKRFNKAKEESDVCNKKIVELCALLKKHWPHLFDQIIENREWLQFNLAWGNLFNQNGFENLLYKHMPLYELYHGYGKDAKKKIRNYKHVYIDRFERVESYYKRSTKYDFFLCISFVASCMV